METLGVCGCPDDHYFNSVEVACSQCATSGEVCSWGFDIERSLRPPALQPGYWASTGALVDEQLIDNGSIAFVGHSIYKCFDADTCMGQRGTCAFGREGVACGLCKPGFAGGPSGACIKCEGSMVAGLVVAVVASPLAVVVANLMLAGQTKERRLFKVLRSFRVSLRQLVKHLQVVSVLAGFTITWPVDVEHVFDAMSVLNFNLVDVAGLGCLGSQQTASLELGLRYAFPVVFVLLGIFLTPLFAGPVSMLLRATPLEKARRLGEVGITLKAACRAVYWIMVLFFPTFLRNGLLLFRCNLHPNEELTVATFPHLHCLGSRSGADSEWLVLLPFGIGYTAAFLGCCIGGYIVVYRMTWKEMEASDYATRGKFAFLFEGFRNSSVHWPILLLCRDAYINAVGAAFNNYGASQMLLVAAGMLGLGFLCIIQRPYVEAANNLAEVMNCMFVFAICMFTAGMGFAKAPGLQDMASLAKGDTGDSIMTTRARILLVLQVASLIGPFLIISFRLLIVVPIIERNLPVCIRPLKADDDAALRDYLRETLNISEGDHVNARNVDRVVGRLDSCELQQLVYVLITSPTASKDVLRETGSSTSLEEIVRRACVKKNASSRDVAAKASEGAGSQLAKVAEQSGDNEHHDDLEKAEGSDREELLQLLKKERKEKQEQADELHQKAATIDRLVQLLKLHSIPVDENEEVPAATNESRSDHGRGFVEIL